jgi:hypothetical protein
VKRKSIKLIHEGKYAAEVPIELIYSEESWSPTMSAYDARKLETVTLALRRGDIAEALKHGRIFELGQQSQWHLEPHVFADSELPGSFQL